MEFPGWDILAAWRRHGENFPIGGITWLEIAGVFLHRPDSLGKDHRDTEMFQNNCWKDQTCEAQYGGTEAIYMYQRINDCYVFFIAIYNNHKWALVARYW